MSSATEQPPQEIFHLDIHAWLDSQQTSHGVRHDDYGQYHAYCTRRLSRLSHKPPAAKAYLVNSSKYASSNPNKPKTAGGRHAFCGRSHDTFALTKEVEAKAEANADEGALAGDDGQPTTTTEVVTVPVPHENILWHLLVNAERSWAHANELQKAHHKRQPVLKKLKRANYWAKLLVEKAKISANAETQKECEAYAAWMAANLAMEQMQYQAASESYARAMSLCHELSGEINENEDSNDPAASDVQRLERHDLFVTRADTILRPLFRYCQYELKQAGLPTMEEPRLQSASGTREEESDDDQDSIVFRDRELILDNKELRVLLLKLQSVEHEQTTEEAVETNQSVQTETQFLTALSILDDATEVVQSLEQGLSRAASSSGPAVQAKLQQYALWRGYLQYTKTRKVMEHTENLLATETMGPAEKVHVCDAVLQHAKSLLNLPRPGDGAGAASNEDDEFVLQVQANILRLRALKTYHMGWCYYTQLFKHGPALALLEHSAKLSKRAREEIAACDEDMPHADEYLSQLEDLPLESAMGAVRAAAALQQRQHARKLQKAAAASGGGSGTTGGAASRWLEPVTTDRPLLLRLYEYDGGTPEAPIADLRPMPLPCKPAFYDLAYGHALDTAGSMDALEDFLYQHTEAPVSEAVEEEKTEGSGGSGGGMFGWLTGK
mmetsp:Transcript_26180/g.71828  ORF Transcript_26180/g.71828 Transcript_26180/m.71828 type:complete len:668 (-) Transcript_26180:157-2160(-)